MAQPMCSSISATFWMLLGSCGSAQGRCTTHCRFKVLTNA
jgi:hypothetical protein